MGNKFSVSYAYSSLSAGMVKFGNGWNKPHTENKEGFGVQGTHARGKEGGGGGYMKSRLYFFSSSCATKRLKLQRHLRIARLAACDRKHVTPRG